MKNNNSFDKDKLKNAESLKTAVMKNLEWSEQDYADFQYEQGLVYLDEYLKGLIAPMDTLLRSRIFWNWWKNHWTLREKYFIISDDLRVSDRRIIYKLTHDGRKLATDIHPNRIVLDESYSDMMYDLVKEEVKPII
jgi:hypothetical protein